MKFSTYVIFFLLFGLLPDLYIVMGTGSASVWKCVLLLPTLAAFASLVFIGMGKWYTDALRVFSYLIFIFELPKFVYMLLSPLGPVSIAAGIAAALSFSTLILYSSRHLKVNTETLYFRNLPWAFNGLKVCQLSDLHLGSFGRRAKYVQKVVDTTLAQHPDIILFTGDLVNFASDEALPYREQLALLKAPMGVFAIRGNHDYLLHGCFDEEQRQKDTDRLLTFERELGIQDMNNTEDLNTLTELKRDYVRARYRYLDAQGKVQYPDANSTMRISYGRVQPLKPWDGVYAHWQSTAKGLREKYDPNNYDFCYPTEWKYLLPPPDFPVNFLTDNDITGGNSGSPVLNAHGELIGLAFDGNKESLASNYEVVDGYNMCVCVDIRYVMWVIQYLGRQDYILKEVGWI